MNFHNTLAEDIIWLTREEIINIIFETFDSVIVNKNKNFTVIKSKWKILEPNNELNILRYKESGVLNGTFDIYFYIWKTKYYSVKIENPDEYDLFLQKVKSRNIQYEEYDYEDGYKHISLRNDAFPCLGYCTIKLPPKKTFKYTNDEFHSLDVMITSCSLNVKKKTFAYYSDLLIGQTILIKIDN
jgi:hypothetical protein